MFEMNGLHVQMEFCMMTVSACRFQCRDSGIQECQLHGVGCGWSGQDPAIVEALLPEHTRLVHCSAWCDFLEKKKKLITCTSGFVNVIFSLHCCKKEVQNLWPSQGFEIRKQAILL